MKTLEKSNIQKKILWKVGKRNKNKKKDWPNIRENALSAKLLIIVKYSFLPGISGDTDGLFRKLPFLLIIAKPCAMLVKSSPDR